MSRLAALGGSSLRPVSAAVCYSPLTGLVFHAFCFERMSSISCSISSSRLFW